MTIRRRPRSPGRAFNARKVSARDGGLGHGLRKTLPIGAVPVLEFDDADPAVEVLQGAIEMTETLRNQARSTDVCCNLPHRHHRYPPHPWGDIRPALAVLEPFRPVERKRRREVGHRIGSMLEVDDLGPPPLASR